MVDASVAVTERYVALGDSYTIGEGVHPDEAWPSLLAAHLRREGIAISLVANPSVTGWTTAQLIEQELPVFEASRPTFATLLIGVNDWVQGVSPADFRSALSRIIDRIQTALPDERRLLLVTIPDFSVTPAAETYRRGRDIAREIAVFNALIREQGERRSLPLADIFPLSQQLGGAEYVAADGLHPSAAAYERWEALIYPVARALLA